MKNFDYYGQMALIISGMLMAIDYKGMGILFAGLVMLILGVWQFISTIANFLGKDRSHEPFFRINFYIAIVYFTLAIILYPLSNGIRTRIHDIVWFIMLGIPPILIFRYWIGISKIYGIGFFKQKNNNGQS